jgi:hypothetical protein
MALTITIAGVDRTSALFLPDQGGDVSGSLIPGARGSMRISVFDRSGTTGYRPAIDQTILLADGATTIFAGLIDDVEEQPLGTDLDVGLMMHITASDWWSYFDRVTYTHAYAAGVSLKTVLQDLIANPLAPFSVTLDGGQATGPTLTDAFTIVGETPMSTISRLTTLTGWVAILTPAKVLRMVAPGTESCGFALGDALTGTLGVVTWKQERNAKYCNRVVLTCGDTSRVQTTETFIAAGGETQFVTKYPAVLDYNSVWPNELFVNGAGLGPVDWTPSILPGHHWRWDAANHTLIVDNVMYTPLAGDVITVTYEIQYPFVVTYDDAAEQAAHGVFEQKFTDTSIFDIDAGNAMAQSIVRQRISLPRQVSVREKVGLAYPGQSITLTYAERTVSGSHLISAVDFRNREDGTLEYTLTCLSGSDLNGSWLDFYRDLLGGSGSSTGASALGMTGGTTSTAIAGGTDKDVQFNDHGVFGGDDAFTFDKAGKNLVLGALSSITATSAEACAVFGYDCHITD